VVVRKLNRPSSGIRVGSRRPVERGLLLTVIAVIEIRFETGDENLKALEMGTFVGAGRFVVEKDRPVVVEYKVSKAVKGA